VQAQQAQHAGGCVYTYQKVSRGWHGDVTITWNVTWGSNQATAPGGALAAVPNATPFVHIVDAVPSVVTKAGS
jgi:hypothetical protein